MIIDKRNGINCHNDDKLYVLCFGRVRIYNKVLFKTMEENDLLINRDHRKKVHNNNRFPFLFMF